jgi:hypothetical protein
VFDFSLSSLSAKTHHLPRQLSISEALIDVLFEFAARVRHPHRIGSSTSKLEELRTRQPSPVVTRDNAVAGTGQPSCSRLVQLTLTADDGAAR